MGQPMGQPTGQPMDQPMCRLQGGGKSCRLTRPCLASIAGSAREHAGRTATVSDTVMHDVMEVLMKKIVSAALLAVALFGVTACSSYPGWVPDWAQIGAEEKS